MTDVLIYADTFRSPELRHEVPIGIPDPFLYAEKAGVKHIVIGSMEVARLREVGGYELHGTEEYGADELVAQGLSRAEIREQIVLRAVRSLGITTAFVPETFPLWTADVLRSGGVELATSSTLFDNRRRSKAPAELAGIRRAQRAAEAGMSAARELLRRAEPGAGGLVADGEVLTSERVKEAIVAAFVAHGATSDECIVARGAQAAVGHDMGSGQIQAGETVVIDLWPRDLESSCFADMTRTFVVGEVAADVAEWHRLCKEALDRAISEIRPGADGRALFDGTCDLFEAAGEPTQRTKEPGVPLVDGFFHSLGHGVGLEVHEEPILGITSKDKLQVGDVVTVEPGLYRQGYGGVRLEDLVLVTEDGAENLTDFPYELQP